MDIERASQLDQILIVRIQSFEPISLNMESKIPQALMKGDTIALVSPSARLHDVIPWRVERAAAFLKHEGYHVKVIHNPQLPKSPLSANIAARAEEVHSAFQDPSVKAIICCIGGWTANELLPALNPEVRPDSTIICQSVSLIRGIRSSATTPKS